MNAYFPQDPMNRIGARILGIRKRTWFVLAASLLVLLILVAWAAVAAVSWVVRQGPALGDAGQRAAGEAMRQVERIVPGIEQDAQSWMRAAQEHAPRLLPGVQERVGDWLPELAPAQPREVSGADVGPVPPVAGLIRDAYSREAGTERARYVGQADLQAVLEHYVRGFENAGYRGEVVAAAQDSEHHRFVRGASSFELKLTRVSGQLQVEVLRTGS
jgi:hypothetical protein